VLIEAAGAAGAGVGANVGAGADAVDGGGVDAAGTDGGTDAIGADGMVADGASCCGTVTGAGCCKTGAGTGWGAGITGEAATGGGAVAGAVPGQGRPVLPPQTVLDEAIATIISSGICSVA